MLQYIIVSSLNRSDNSMMYGNEIGSSNNNNNNRRRRRQEGESRCVVISKRFVRPVDATQTQPYLPT